jgi:hypothetical protein
MKIEKVSEVTDELLVAFNHLAPQLSANILLPTRLQLEEIVASPATTLLIARDSALGNGIIGTLTLAVYR